MRLIYLLLLCDLIFIFPVRGYPRVKHDRGDEFAAFAVIL